MPLTILALPSPLLLLASLLVPASATVAVQQVEVEAGAVAASLDTRLAIGFATDDRSFRLESFEATARALADSLDYELWWNGAQEGTASDDARPRLVAMERWEEKDRELASELGVESVVVVKSATGKRGKATKKRYVKNTEMFTGALGTSVTYVGLTYRIKFEVQRPLSSDVGSSWEPVSSWRIDEDERDAPTSINLASAVDGKITLTLEDVIKAKSLSPISAAAQMASFETVKRVSGEIAGVYGSLSEQQKAEFWTRATAASRAALAMPIQALLDLAFEEWDEEDQESGAEILKRKEATEKHGDNSKPATIDEILRSFRDRNNGSAYLFGSPSLRAAQRFVHSWSSDISRTAPLLSAPPGSIRELWSECDELAVGSHGRAAAMSYGELDIAMGATVPQLTTKSRLSSGVILLSEDTRLPDLFKDAPAPRLLYATVLRYSDQQAKDERKRKFKRFKKYDGAQLITYRDGKYQVLRKVSRAKLTGADVYQMLKEIKSPKWPDGGE